MSSQPLRLSSSLTLVLSIMVPVLWASFFGSMMIVVLFKGAEMGGVFASIPSKLAYIVFYVLFLALIWFTLGKLRRVEADDHFVYVYNYFKQARYPYHNVKALRITDLGIFQIGTLRLQKGGIFGKRIHFLVSKKKIEIAAKQIYPLADAILSRHSA